MIVGTVTEEDVPEITLTIGDHSLSAIVDTGFNGFLELPETLKDDLNLTDAGPVESFLAAGQVVIEQSYDVELPFDGETVVANVTFAESSTCLLGTMMLQDHQLQIDFPNRSLSIRRTRADD